jgi:membrane associated rhomboid family serine protease
MLEDRYYMRQSPFDARRSATVILVVVNAIAFILQLAAYRFAPGFPTDGYFALSIYGLRHGYIWQLLTYMFMHAGFLHLLFNCWAIYVFGRDVEDALGLKSFLTLYFSSGIIGGVFQTTAGLGFGQMFGGATLGASAAAFGLVAAYAMLFPERILLLFFVIPVRAKYLLALSLLIAVVGVLAPENSPSGPHVADAAHLGGILTGFVFVRYAMHWNLRWPRLKFGRPQGRAPRQLVKVVSGGKSPPWSSAEDLPPEEFLSKEVDPILDKISAHGIQSLTEKERKVLEAARQRIKR